MNAIEVAGVCKRYRQYAKPIHVFKEWLLRSPCHTVVEALAPIDINIPKGQTFGVIGDNGAGKSTLLKILADTVVPSTGKVQMNGRYSAILELGSGFHPEFSGLENIRMSCSLLGLSAKETEQRIPDIIEFSELEDAIHRPVKTYSSGMFVRLAFSVVTSVNPDILIVDEALSVGDANFQKKSINRMMRFRQSGKTLVFCSHNLYQVKELCDQAVWLDQGKVKKIGDTASVVDAYQDFTRSKETAFSAPISSESLSANMNDVALQKIQLLGSENTVGNTPFFEHGKYFAIQVDASTGGHDLNDIHLGLVIVRNDGLQVYGTSTVIDQTAFKPVSDGMVTVRLVFDQLQLLAGEYALEVWLIDSTSMHVYDSQPLGSKFVVRHNTTEVGICWMPHRWE